MDLLSCYLVDDEMSAIENMQAMLSRYCTNVHVMGFSTSIKEASAFLALRKPDVLLLDIRMQNETGFDLMRLLPDFEGSLIFVTAYDHYGLQAIKLSAVEYLLKPVNSEELIDAVLKASRKKTLTETKAQITMLVESFENQKRNQQKKMALPDADEIQYVNIEDIIFCSSSNTYTTFHIAGRKSVLVSKPISEFEVLLQSYGFIRIHQSFLINKNKIASYKKADGGNLIMENGMAVPVSRQRKHLLKDLF